MCYRSHAPRRTVICVDDESKQLLRTTRLTLPIQPGRPQRADYEYERGRTVNLFVTCESLAGQPWVSVTARRTNQDFAHLVKTLVNHRHPHTEQIVPVLDNLNTHTPAAWFETFFPSEARRLTDKLQWH